ncbi:transposase [Streptomyces sp. PT12]|uniref:transposase n=1 Tax=Streptomyces sp. PT12 TaxID=1510197 RepID=UPI001C6864F1
MIRRHELSDAEWEFVRPLLPVSSRGRKWLDDCRVLNGIVWKFRTGTAWRDVPERYGPWPRCTLPAHRLAPTHCGPVDRTEEFHPTLSPTLNSRQAPDIPAGRDYHPLLAGESRPLASL